MAESRRRGGLKRGALDSVVVPKASLELDEYGQERANSERAPSLMFPSTRPSFESSPLRSIPQQLSKAGSQSVMSDSDTLIAGARAYGADDDARSIKSNHLAGSRPASLKHGKMPANSKAFSITSGGTVEGAAQYLYLHDPPSRASRPTVVSSSRASADTRKGLAVPASAGGAASSMHGEVIDEQGESAQPDSLAVPPTNGARKRSNASEPLDLSPQQAWYLLRTLVGLEVSNEAGKLHRLTNLSPDIRSSRARGFGDDQENNYEYGDEIELSAKEMPILRYMVKHFLLTFPFIRDVTPETVHIDGGRAIDDTFDADDVPYYWKAGILPMLRALHAADLSQPVELGRRSLGSILFGIYGSHAMERFVASGLRITGSGPVEDPLARAGAAVPASNGGRSSQMTPVASRTENPFTRSMLGSPNGRRSKGFSGLFRPRSQRDSITNTPDLAGPQPAGHLSPIANELSSDAESDDDDEASHALAAANRKKAEEALAGGAIDEDAIATPKTPASRKSTPSRKSIASREIPVSPTQGHAKKLSEVSATETDDSAEMQTAENGDMTDAEDGRPSAASTVGHQSRDSAVTAPEGDSVDLTPNGGPETPAAKAGIISSVVGYFTGTGAVDPPAATSTPKKTPEIAHQASSSEDADQTLRAPETDDAASSETEVPPLPGGNLFIQQDKRMTTGVGHHAFSDEVEREDAGKPKEETKGYEVPDESDVKSNGVGMLWVSNDGREILAPASPKQAPASPQKSKAPASPRARLADYDDEKPLSPAKRPPRTTSRSKEDKEADAQRKKAHLAAVAATGVSAPSSKKRGFSIASFTNSLKKSKSQPAVAQPEPRKANEDKSDWYAPLNMPMSLQHSSAGPSGSATPVMTIDAPADQSNAINDYSPNDFFNATTTGHDWPWGSPVPFWKGTPVHRVAWGGFEADVVGVRKGAITGHTFIIRVRRPQRLDEYVLRDESQFKKYLGILDKQYPHAHLRGVPEGKISAFDDAVDPSAHASAMIAKQREKAERRKTDNSFMRPLSLIGRSTSAREISSRSESGIEPASDAISEPELNNRQSVGKKPSRLSMRLRQAASVHGDEPQPRNRLSRSAPASRRGTVSGPPPLPMVRGRPSIPDGQPLPYLDAQRRALRNWLRDTLSVRTVGHNKETAAFLLLGSVRLKEPELRDIQYREMIDEGRKHDRIGVAQGAADRSKQAHQIYSSVVDEMIMGDGLLALSESIRDNAKFEQLPPRFIKALEWSRFSTAQALHSLLVAGEHSGPLFLKLKKLNAAIPWFLLRQAFKLPNAGLMSKGLQDLLLNSRFGKQSLLNKALVAILDDDPRTLNDQIEACRARIQSTGICEKLTRFVYASRETKDLIRKHAAEHNMELVVTIVRGADEPRLDRYDLERVVRAAKIHKSFMKRNPTPAAKVKTENGSVRLILDMQIFLRLLSRERDAHEIRGVLADERTTEAFQVLVAPLMEFFKRAYRDADMARVISDIQKFIDQLIVIIEALRSRIQDPQKAVRILARLLSRHTQPFYHFIHTLHREDTIIEELFQWLWTATTFLRRGLAKQVDLASLMPHDANDKRFLLEELDAIAEYHKRKRQRQYELMCRRYAGDIDSDDPVIVEGDGFGKSRLEPLVEQEPRVPRLFEIPRIAETFRETLVGIFSV